MLVTCRHLLRPTSGQRVRLDALLEMQRQLYNAANVAGRGVRAHGTFLAA